MNRHYADTSGYSATIESLLGQQGYELNEDQRYAARQQCFGCYADGRDEGLFDPNNPDLFVLYNPGTVVAVFDTSTWMLHMDLDYYRDFIKSL
jgi:hypothetical protein